MRWRDRAGRSSCSRSSGAAATTSPARWPRSRPRRPRSRSVRACAWRGRDVSDSIWKKEISFGRKPKEEGQQTDEAAADAPAEPKQSCWKKEIGKPKLPKEPKAAKLSKAPDEQKQSI